MIIAMDAKILFDGLVHVLGLAVCLRVEGGRQSFLKIEGFG